MSLYSIDSTINQLLTNGFNEECIDTDTGEILEDKAKELLDKLNLDRHTKIENIALFIKNLNAEVTDIKSEESALKDRRTKKENKVKYLSSLIANSLINANEKSFETSKVALSFKKSEAVSIINLSLVPKKYIKTKTEESADKTAIKKAIKDGKVIDGVLLEEKQNLQIK